MSTRADREVRQTALAQEEQISKAKRARMEGVVGGTVLLLSTFLMNAAKAAEVTAAAADVAAEEAAPPTPKVRAKAKAKAVPAPITKEELEDKVLEELEGIDVDGDLLKTVEDLQESSCLSSLSTFSSQSAHDGDGYVAVSAIFISRTVIVWVMMLMVMRVIVIVVVVAGRDDRSLCQRTLSHNHALKDEACRGRWTLAVGIAVVFMVLITAIYAAPPAPVPSKPPAPVKCGAAVEERPQLFGSIRLPVHSSPAKHVASPAASLVATCNSSGERHRAAFSSRGTRSGREEQGKQRGAQGPAQHLDPSHQRHPQYASKYGGSPQRRHFDTFR
ncbi:hypothetical protein AK812_SmicGene4088 [Symbiodinium microadriaticum]|uniref:Uncharacterized protein n=1 Tax=Symbiodinium microadriaticum TaxID=2951 RepID=A0A1Q9EX67_SYMMI|nr:hypothetical protein AK812_SmicGene4088 [Symbiodinium microadriaticum]